MKTVNYTVRELKRLVRESASEFEPKLGPNVKRDNKSNNEKSYKETAKRIEDYDGGLKKEKTDYADRNDYNKTTLHYNPVIEPSDDYKKRVRSQVKGYSSEMEEKNGSEKNGSFDGNERILKDLEKSAKDTTKNRETLAKSGLQARELPDDWFKRNTLTEKAKKLTFKRRFINEANMLQRIPDEYKVDGQKIFMNDRDGNEYVVECTKSEKSGIIETNVVSYCNRNKLNEEVDRMYKLFDFGESTDNRMSNAEKINENKAFGEMMNLARGK